MDIEQKAIKAVANVAAQAYRKAFDVKPDMTTGELAVMADAIAALDQPTLAPKIDKEYAIWRAIGSLTQRVRDLEQPTAPEPPVIGVSNGKDTIWHDPEVRMVNSIDKCPTCLGTGKVVRLEPVKTEPAEAIHPEASQPLPAEVEAAVNETERMILALHQTNSARDAVIEVFRVLRVRLTTLLPKAGQVPSVEEIRAWHWGTEKRTVDLIGYTVELQTKGAKDEREWLLSRMGQPAKPDKFDCDNCDVTDLRPVQPSPVTAEKLAEYLREEMSHWPSPVSTMAYSAWEGLAQGILKAFPALGQGRLTRDDPRVKAAVEKFLKEANYSPGPLFRTLITDLLALQPQAKVSKEQWEKLDRFPMDEPEMRAVKAWLKAEFGMEVAK